MARRDSDVGCQLRGGRDIRAASCITLVREREGGREREERVGWREREYDSESGAVWAAGWREETRMFAACCGKGGRV